MWLRLSLLLSTILLLPISAQAHKIHVFAWASGSTVTVESGFSADRPLINGRVTVKDSRSGTVFLEGTGDKEGIFTFEVPDPAREAGADLLIVVTGGEGHQSQWLLPAAEYGAVSPSPPAAAPSPSPGGNAIATANNEELKEMLQGLLEQELAPIKRSLAESRQNKPGFRDIMGGIGYLLGLAGLVAWFKNRPAPSKGDRC